MSGKNQAATAPETRLDVIGPLDGWPTSPDGYTGDIAENYEVIRARQRAWAREHRLIDRWCRSLPAGTSVLDVPCGTGRLLPIFGRRGIRMLGADVSADMLRQIPPDRLQMPTLRGLTVCDAQALPFGDQTFDYVVSLRLFHLGIDLDLQKRMLREFLRTARRGVMLHLVMTDRGLVERAADFTWRAVRHGHELPGKLAVRLKRGRVKRGPGGPRPARRWRHNELQQAVGDAGFVVSRMYGAGTPFSAKKLCVIERAHS